MSTVTRVIAPDLFVRAEYYWPSRSVLLFVGDAARIDKVRGLPVCECAGDDTDDSLDRVIDELDEADARRLLAEARAAWAAYDAANRAWNANPTGPQPTRPAWPVRLARAATPATPPPACAPPATQRDHFGRAS